VVIDKLWWGIAAGYGATITLAMNVGLQFFIS
jgi:hypothetical protein